MNEANKFYLKAYLEARHTVRVFVLIEFGEKEGIKKLRESNVSEEGISRALNDYHELVECD